MSEPVRLQLPNGEHIWARVQVDGPTDVAWRDAHARLDDFADTVRTIAASVHQALTAAHPDQVSVEFGIELAVKGGKVISLLADSAVKTSLRVTLAWNPANAAAQSDRDGDEDPTGARDQAGEPEQPEPGEMGPTTVRRRPSG